MQDNEAAIKRVFDKYADRMLDCTGNIGRVGILELALRDLCAELEAERAKREAVAVPAGYRLQPLSEYEAMRAALDLPEGNFPKWKEALIDEMQSSYDTDGIMHVDSGDPLIYLQSAIAIIEGFELPLAASQPKEAP